MTKIEQLKAAYEGMQAVCTVGAEARRLTHTDMEGQEVPCTVYDVKYTYRNDRLVSARVTPIVVLGYRIADGASVPTLLYRRDGDMAQSAVEMFYPTEEAAQTEVDEALCAARREDAVERFHELSASMMPELLEAAELLAETDSYLREIRAENLDGSEPELGRLLLRTRDHWHRLP